MINLPDMRHYSICSYVHSLKTEVPRKIVLDFNTLILGPSIINNMYFGLEKTEGLLDTSPKWPSHKGGRNAFPWLTMPLGFRVTLPLNS